MRLASVLTAALGCVAVLAGAIVGAAQLRLLDAVYDRLLGPADLGAVAFGTLARRSFQSDALACPPGECGSAAVDIRPSAYPVHADELRLRVRRYFASQGAVLAAQDDASQQDRFVIRDGPLRLPATIDVEIVPVDAEHATLAAYSRSRLDIYDFGTDLRRLQGLLAALGPGVASASLDVSRMRFAGNTIQDRIAIR
jgi:hypothetical protein